MAPIRQGLCPNEIRPNVVVKPLAGGHAAYEPARPFNPAPGALVPSEQDLNADANVAPLGAPNASPFGVSDGISTGVSTGVSGALGQ